MSLKGLSQLAHDQKRLKSRTTHKIQFDRNALAEIVVYKNMDVRSTYDLKRLKSTCARSRRIGSYELSCVNMRLVHDYKRVLYEDATKSLE